jgi:hypothetical protein
VGEAQRSDAVISPVNSTDAIVLRVALDMAQHLRRRGDDLVLVAADRHLFRAAQREWLGTFDPESQDQAVLAMFVPQGGMAG